MRQMRADGALGCAALGGRVKTCARSLLSPSAPPPQTPPHAAQPVLLLRSSAPRGNIRKGPRHASVGGEGGF